MIHQDRPIRTYYKITKHDAVGAAMTRMVQGTTCVYENIDEAKVSVRRLFALFAQLKQTEKFVSYGALVVIDERNGNVLMTRPILSPERITETYDVTDAE